MSVARRTGKSRGLRCLSVMLLCPALLTGLSACGSGGQPAIQPSAEQPTGTHSSSSTGEAVQADTRKRTGTKRPAPEMFKSVLRELLAKDGDPSREQIAAAIKSAGFGSKDVEMSSDTTPTGLEVDAVEVAVKRDGKCIVAQLRDGKAAATTLPVLASGHCFVGDQR